MTDHGLSPIRAELHVPALLVNDLETFISKARSPSIAVATAQPLLLRQFCTANKTGTTKLNTAPDDDPLSWQLWILSAWKSSSRKSTKPFRVYSCQVLAKIEQFVSAHRSNLSQNNIDRFQASMACSKPCLREPRKFLGCNYCSCPAQY